MNLRQKSHLKSIEHLLITWLRAKYTKGAEEHHGDLLDLTELQLVDEAINESIDQIVYLLTLRQKINGR